MYNEHIFNKINREFGLEKSIQFTEMLSYMYKIMSEEPGASLEFAYEQEWWKQKHEQLKHNINDRLDGKISVHYEGAKEMASRNDAEADGF